jgi:hypothetical protein
VNLATDCNPSWGEKNGQNELQYNAQVFANVVVASDASMELSKKRKLFSKRTVSYFSILEVSYRKLKMILCLIPK